MVGESEHSVHHGDPCRPSARVQSYGGTTPAPIPRNLCAVEGSRGAAQMIKQELAPASDEAALTSLVITWSRDLTGISGWAAWASGSA